MLKIWKQKTPLRPAQVCLSTGTLVHLTALALSPSALFRFILFTVKVIGKQFKHGLQKNGEHLSFAAEVQASLWTAREFSAKVQYRNWHYSSKRAWKTYTYATKNQVLGIFQTRKQTNHKIGLAIFMTTFIYFSYPETFAVQNMPKAYKKTGLISNFKTVCTK